MIRMDKRFLLLTVLSLALIKTAAGFETLSEEECINQGGECRSRDNCESADDYCETEDTVCCLSTAKKDLNHIDGKELELELQSRVENRKLSKAKGDLNHIDVKELKLELQSRVESRALSEDECFAQGGQCLPGQSCESATVSCDSNGTACCLPSMAKRDLSNIDAVEFRVRDFLNCANRRCRKEFDGDWVSNPFDCHPKDRLVSYCKKRDLWCCAPPCKEKDVCLERGGYCVKRRSDCPGRGAVQGLCTSKTCFCCIPYVPRPACDCPENIVSICDGLNPISLPADGCLTVVSPGFPLAYPPDTHCKLTVETKPRCQIEVEFCEVDLEQCFFDLLQMTGTNFSAPVCGSYTPPNALSEGNSVSLNFSSDAIQNDLGFQLVLKTICEPLTTTTTTSSTSTSTTTTSSTSTSTSTTTTGPPVFIFCDTTAITEIDGIINTPGYPIEYSNDLNCSLTLTVPDGFVISLDYLDFDVEDENECGYDYFRVYEATDSPSLAPKFCGTTTPNFTLSTTNSLILEFGTDSSVLERGISIYFKAV